MPTILTDNFKFRSSLPNFERDRVNTLNDLKSVEDGTLDIGHIVYVISEGIHYIYKGYGIDPEPLIPDNILDISDLREDIIDIAANVSDNTLNIEDHKSRIEELENNSNNYKDEVLSEAKDYTDAQVDSKLEDYYTKTESDIKYATVSELNRLSNSYNPNNDLDNAVITWGKGDDDNLYGQQGKSIRNNYTYNQILDKILFKKEIPEIVNPTITISHNDGQTEFIGKINDSIPNLICTWTDGEIKYPWKNNVLYTNGPDTNNNWEQICIKNGIRYESSTFNDIGEYRFYWEGKFNSNYQKVYDNRGELILDSWDRQRLVRSENYITYFITKPVINHSNNNEEILIRWDETEMEVYLECAPSGQKEQSFTLPRLMKRIYVYNDIAGDYAESDTNHYNRSGYKYTYNSTKYGHRGAVKLKIVF